MRYISKFLNIFEFFEQIILDSAVSLRLQNRFSRSHWNRETGFRGLTETAETDPVVSL
jgi:hypothetical protein